MKWIMTGAQGFIGSIICDDFSRKFEVLGIDKLGAEAKNFFSASQVDICNKNEIASVFDRFQPNCVVHFAGTKNVGWCEKNREEAFRLNTEAVRLIAETASEYSCFMIFLSSDYVFDGKEGSYSIESKPNPLTVYGKTKWESEKILADHSTDAAIIRTAGVYASEHPAQSLLGWAQDVLQKREDLEAFCNVYNSPTYVQDLARAIEVIGKERMSGLYHLAGSSKESRSSFLQNFAREFGFDVNLIKESKFVPSGEFQRPLDLSLNSEDSYQKIGFKFCSAQEGLRKAKTNLKKEGG